MRRPGLCSSILWGEFLVSALSIPFCVSIPHRVTVVVQKHYENIHPNRSLYRAASGNAVSGVPHVFTVANRRRVHCAVRGGVYSLARAPKPLGESNEGREGFAVILEASQHNIKWLMERLYQVRRELNADAIEEPTFVLLTKGKEDRDRVEQVFWNYYRSKYAMFEDVIKSCKPGGRTSHATWFELAEIGCRIVLMDI